MQGRVGIAAGYGYQVLDQDSFSQRQVAAGYRTGKITTQTAFVNVGATLPAGVGVDAFVRYNDRSNDSSFPVAGLLDPAADQTLGVRINGIEALSYGLSASMRAAPLKTTFTAGWKHEDKDRDLTWTAVSLLAPVLNGIAPQRSFYQAKTNSDEFSLKLVSRPTPGMTLRITPFFQSASETGQVTEPEESTGVKLNLAQVLGKDTLISGYYDYKSIENARHTLSGNAAASLVPTGTVTQSIDKTLQTAGLSLSTKPTEWINASASLTWFADDFSSYFLRSDRRRFEQPAAVLTFLAVDRPEYDVESYVLSLNCDWQASDQLRWKGGYSLSKSDGSTASGYVGDALAAVVGGVDGRIDTTVHSLTLGVDYELKQAVKLKAAYSYDYYDDRVYRALTGGVNTVMLSVAFGL